MNKIVIGAVALALISFPAAAQKAVTTFSADDNTSAAASTSPMGNSTGLRVGTGGPTGNYFSMANDIVRYCGSTIDAGLEVVNSAGSVDNISGMSNKKYAIGIVQQDVLQYMAKRDSSRYNDNRMKVITGLHSESVHLLIPVGYTPSTGGFWSNIANKLDSVLASGGTAAVDINLLKNQEVGSWGGSVISAKALSLFLGLNMNIVDVPEDQRASWSKPILLVGGQPYKPVEDYLASGRFYLVGIDASSVRAQAPFYMASTISYPVRGKVTDVPTIAVRAVMLGVAFRSSERNKPMSDLAQCVTDSLSDLADDPNTNPNWASVYEFEQGGNQISWQYFPIR